MISISRFALVAAAAFLMCALVSSTKHQGDGSAPIFGKLTRDWRAVDCDNPKNSSEVTQCFILVVIDIMMSVWNSIFGSYRSGMDAESFLNHIQNMMEEHRLR